MTVMFYVHLFTLCLLGSFSGLASVLADGKKRVHTVDALVHLGLSSRSSIQGYRNLSCFPKRTLKE